MFSATIFACAAYACAAASAFAAYFACAASACAAATACAAISASAASSACTTADVAAAFSCAAPDGAFISSCAGPDCAFVSSCASADSSAAVVALGGAYAAGLVSDNASNGAAAVNTQFCYIFITMSYFVILYLLQLPEIVYQLKNYKRKHDRRRSRRICERNHYLRCRLRKTLEVF